MPSATAQRKRQWTSADRDQRTELITQTGLDLLSKHGPEGVTIRRVAEKLGVGAMTLYTYIDGQDGLRRAMIRKGFEMLDSGCAEASTLESEDGWKGGSLNYLRFAQEQPNLYKLMFDTWIPDSDLDVLKAGISGLLGHIRMRLEAKGLTGEKLERETLDQAGRFWIGLHGLASLHVANRLGTLERDLDYLLDDLLERIAPD